MDLSDYTLDTLHVKGVRALPEPSPNGHETRIRLVLVLMSNQSIPDQRVSGCWNTTLLAGRAGCGMGSPPVELTQYRANRACPRGSRGQALDQLVGTADGRSDSPARCDRSFCRSQAFCTVGVSSTRTSNRPVS